MSIERKSYGDKYSFEEMRRYIDENYYKKITLQNAGGYDFMYRLPSAAIF